MRVVWVSFDAIGRACAEACAEAGADVVGVVTLPPPIDLNRSGQCAFDEVASRLDASLIEVSDVNTPDSVEAVRALEPDLIFVVGWSQLVRLPLIRLAANGTFGMHPTLLPRHRGRAAIPWTILSGLAATGVTLFQIVDETADSGPIVDQIEVPVTTNETATSLYAKILEAHVELIRRSVPLLLAGRAPRLPQDERRASAWPRRTPADGIIDWETRAPYLDTWVRAQTRPYPGAFTYARDTKVIVWRARTIGLENGGAPGTVLERREDGVVVACGDGALLLEEVEPVGSAPLTGEAIGAWLRVGDRLG
jgi:methionyl-tRNA formyltransferase